MTFWCSMSLHIFHFNGQLISIDVFFVFDSSKKRTKNFGPRAKFCQHFVCFLEWLRRRKIASEIIWPLGGTSPNSNFVNLNSTLGTLDWLNTFWINGSTWCDKMSLANSPNLECRIRKGLDHRGWGVRKWKFYLVCDENVLTYAPSQFKEIFTKSITKGSFTITFYDWFEFLWNRR